MYVSVWDGVSSAYSKPLPSFIKLPNCRRYSRRRQGVKKQQRQPYKTSIGRHRRCFINREKSGDDERDRCSSEDTNVHARQKPPPIKTQKTFSRTHGEDFNTSPSTQVSAFVCPSKIIICTLKNGKTTVVRGFYCTGFSMEAFIVLGLVRVGYYTRSSMVSSSALVLVWGTQEGIRVPPTSLSTITAGSAKPYLPPWMQSRTHLEDAIPLMQQPNTNKKTRGRTTGAFFQKGWAAKGCQDVDTKNAEAS